MIHLSRIYHNLWQRDYVQRIIINNVHKTVCNNDFSDSIMVNNHGSSNVLKIVYLILGG